MNRKIQTSGLPDHPLDEKYLPSNGTEGDWFIGKFCHNCKNLRSQDDPETWECKILAATLFEGKHVADWIITEEGPECTSFVDIKSEDLPERCEKTIDIFWGISDDQQK